MKALVTGATGFLGRRIVSQLLGRGIEVCCPVRPTSNVSALYNAAGPTPPNQLRVVRCNLESIDAAWNASEHMDVCFHLASEMKGAPSVLFRSNVHATRKLLDFACRLRPERLVHVSSLGVYGTRWLREGDILDERCPLDPEPHRRDGYTYSKVAQEKVVWASCTGHSIPLVVVRPGVVFGPGRDCITPRVGLRFGNFLLQMGSLRQLPYTYVDNCAEAIVRAGLAPGLAGETFNIVDDDLPSCRDLVNAYRSQVRGLHHVIVPNGAIASLSGLCEWYNRWSNGQLPAILTRYKSAALWKPLRFSNEKAKTRLGWKPAVDFPTALNATLAWLHDRTLSETQQAA